MLKNYRKINKYLTDWCEDHGFFVKCKLGTDFEYEEDTKTIYYALAIPDAHDKLFWNVCKDYLQNVEKCDNFILSFFHELGHFVNDIEFTDEDWDKYYDLVDRLKAKENLSDKVYYKYYTCDVELTATKWGCNYIDNHLNIVAEFWNNLKPLIMNFYKTNKIEITEELEFENKVECVEAVPEWHFWNEYPKTINVLGTDYKIMFVNYEDEEVFKEDTAIGLCNSINKWIKVCKLETCPSYKTLKDSEDEKIYLTRYYGETLRHEIIHAFTQESGLSSDSHTADTWATDEEIIDWLAIQTPKMFKIFTELNILE